MAKIRSVSLAFILVALLFMCSVHAQLRDDFYSLTCPNLQTIVRDVMQSTFVRNAYLVPSILRLFFLDCFVNGCDASILLKDTPTFTGEQSAVANANIRGMDVIETIKSAVEASCNSTVSCADILALAARDAVVLTQGPSWTVPLGRRDSRTASQSAANSNIPGPSSSLSTLITSFANKGLNLRDLVALSGAHTLGEAHCSAFRKRIYTDTNIHSGFADLMRYNCEQWGGDDRYSAYLDMLSPTEFDNQYYENLPAGGGLLHSDQELFNNGSADSIVRSYAASLPVFFSDFVSAMIKMGNISPLTGSKGEIRKVCSRVN